MRQRNSARLLITNADGAILLFRFVHKSGTLAGQDYWATPGGGVEDGESFHDTAVRELREETGILRMTLGEPLATREFTLQLPDGEYVHACERYYRVTSDGDALSAAGRSPQEVSVIAEHRWWSMDQLTQTSDTVWPENLVQMLAGIAAKRAS